MSPIDRIPARTLRAALAAGDLTHTDVAQMLGVPLSVVKNWAAGRTPVPAERVAPVIALLEARDVEIVVVGGAIGVGFDFD
jgi:DNA-binding transcriptional regulator YdaS (Cro superfamily)